MLDVARAAGVSKALVSIVFRGAPGASEHTRTRVLRVADELGYRANRSASLLKLRRTKHLGVSMQIRSAFHGELVEGVQGAADRAGYQIVLSAVTPTHDERRAIETLLEFRCEALILFGSGLSDGALERLAVSVPVVLVGQRTRVGGIDVVRAADDRGQELLVDHLVGLGHQQIAHIDGGAGRIAADRRRGYRSAMRRHGLGEEVVVLSGGDAEQDGRRAAAALVGLESPPTAVTCFNDHCALGVLDGLRGAGIEVPARMSVAGYDDSPVSRFASIALTSVSQDAPAQAELAVRAAIDRLEGRRDRPHEAVLEPRLVVRGTTAPPVT